MQIALGTSAIPAAAVRKRGLRMLHANVRQRPDIGIPCSRLIFSCAAIQLQRASWPCLRHKRSTCSRQRNQSVQAAYGPSAQARQTSMVTGLKLDQSSQLHIFCVGRSCPDTHAPSAACSKWQSCCIGGSTPAQLVDSAEQGYGRHCLWCWQPLHRRRAGHPTTILASCVLRFSLRASVSRLPWPWPRVVARHPPRG